MRKLMVGLGAAVALAVPGVATAQFDEDEGFAPTPGDDCGAALGNIGPNGWQTANTWCWSIQDANRMQRVRIKVHRHATGQELWLYGDWEDCNALHSTRQYDTNASTLLAVQVRVTADNIPGGC